MGNNLLKGKRGIVFGALNDMSIAWKVAERVVEEGAIITLSNTPLAVRMGTTNELAQKLNAKLIPADATSVTDLEEVFAQSTDALGGKIDFILHSIGMSIRRTFASGKIFLISSSICSVPNPLVFNPGVLHTGQTCGIASVYPQ